VRKVCVRASSGKLLTDSWQAAVAKLQSASCRWKQGLKLGRKLCVVQECVEDALTLSSEARNAMPRRSAQRDRSQFGNLMNSGAKIRLTAAGAGAPAGAPASNCPRNPLAGAT
jgi:hypothetical protein